MPTTQKEAGHQRDGQRVLSNPDLTAVSGEIQHAIELLKSQDDAGRVLLVIDQLDLLLATGDEPIGPVEIEEMLLGLREVCTVPLYTCSQLNIVLECSRNDPDPLSGQPVGVKPADPARIKSCSGFVRHSARSRFHHELKALGFRHGKGCQWSR